MGSGSEAGSDQPAEPGFDAAHLVAMEIITTGGFIQHFDRLMQGCRSRFFRVGLFYIFYGSADP